MANIFGQKELAERTQVKAKSQEEKSDRILETEVSGFKDNWYGVTTINSGNMTDYFKLKSNYNNMSDYLKCNVNSINDTSLSNNMTDNQMINSENENDQHIGLGFVQKMEDTSLSSCRALKDSEYKSNFAFDNPCLGLSSSTETVCDINSSFKSAKSTKKRKKEFESDSLHITKIDKHNTRKKLKAETIESNCKNGFINPALNLNTKSEDYNGKEFEVFRTQFGLENCGLDLTDERNNKKRVTFNDHIMLYEYNINSVKNKKGEVTLDKFEVENKKSKKKRKHENITTPITNGFVNEALDIQTHEEINDNELNEHRNKKIKKRKICKTSSLETIQESPEKEIIEIDIESENILDTSIVEIKDTNTELEQKSKKKKKKKEKEEKKAKVKDITVLRVINKETDIEIVETIRSKKIKKNKESKEEEVVISKKNKKKKKKEKENCKSEKHTNQREINNEQQNIQILNKSDSNQQNNHFIENKDVIEILPILRTKEEEGKEESLAKIKHKKKKRKCQEGIVSKEDFSSQIDVCNIEREISNKENTDKEHDPNIKKLAKKDKKNKKLKDKNLFNVEESSNSNKEFIDVNGIKQDKIENVEVTDSPSKKDKMIDAIDTVLNSPWNVKTRMSKKMLITLFHNNAILEFPGSNIHNIKGYGTDFCEL